MADAARTVRGLRTRSKMDKRPLEQLSTGERGLRAAHAVTTGTYSPGTAAHTFCVDRDCLRYYRKKLLDSGFDELHASVSAGTTSASAPVEEPAIASKVDEWTLYCDAYMHAGMHPKLLRPSSSAQMRGRAATPLLSSSVLKWPQGSSRRPTSRS